MYKKKFLLILFVVFLGLNACNICIAAGTAENDNVELPNVFVYENNITRTNANGGLLFLFSSAVLEESHVGYILSFFSNIQVGGEFKGDIYSFFSDIKVDMKSSFDGIINSISSNVFIAKDLIGRNIYVKGISIFDLFLKTAQTDDYIVYSNEIPYIVLQALVAIFNVCACGILFFIKKSFMEQGSVLLKEEPLEVIRNGIITYFILIGCMILLALTVFLIPLILLVFLITICMVLVGEAALSIYVGYIITDSVRPGGSFGFGGESLYARMRISSFVCMMIGVICIEAIKIVPVIGFSVSFLFLPLITLGMLITAVANGFLKKVFYETPYYDNNKNNFDIKEIRDIILK